MLNFAKVIHQTKKSIEKSQNLQELKSINIFLFGKKGFFNKKIMSLPDISYEQRIIIGQIVNKEKKIIQELLNKRKKILETKLINEQLLKEKIDISLPGRYQNNSGLHPVTLTYIKIKNFFKRLGFSTTNGLEIEDEYYNFDALNISKYHPTRTEHDTFWLNTKKLLRTQTSGVQIHIMQSSKPPIRIISSGRVYRNDNDKKHTPMFHQIEGLMVDYNLTFTDLKGILYDFLYYFFEKKIQIRFRPSYFPFTEPSAEIDIMEEKNNSWLEILGCGMIHPNVLLNVGINSNEYSGFAFGIGIERLAMINYKITDLRMFFKNDLRFLQQFN